MPSVPVDYTGLGHRTLFVQLLFGRVQPLVRVHLFMTRAPLIGH